MIKYIEQYLYLHPLDPANPYSIPENYIGYRPLENGTPFNQYVNLSHVSICIPKMHHVLMRLDEYDIRSLKNLSLDPHATHVSITTPPLAVKTKNDILKKPKITIGTNASIKVNGSIMPTIPYENGSWNSEIGCQVIMEPKCVCGTDSIGGGMHSTWCDKHDG